MRTAFSPKTELTLEEAVAIARQAEAGNLDTTDPTIRRTVGDANQILVRTRIWGERPSSQQRRSRRLLLIGTSAVLGVWIAGLFVPLLMHVQ
jgi:hypothetical protein